MLKEVQTVCEGLPDEIKVDVEQWNDLIIVKPKGWLGSENFSKLSEALRNLGGEYRSFGKLSHFIVPIKREKETTVEDVVAAYEDGTLQSGPKPKPIIKSLNVTLQLLIEDPKQVERYIEVLRKHVI